MMNAKETKTAYQSPLALILDVTPVDILTASGDWELPPIDDEE